MLIALKSKANGKLVCSESAGVNPLVANRDVAAEWETFDMFYLDAKHVALRAVINNKFVCAENKGASPLIANRDAVGEWETFEKVDMGGNSFALKAMANGKFVCAENAGALPLIANRAAAAQWETFEEVPRQRFSPVVHGFKFENSGFANNVISETDFRTNALCGGMAYAVLDYYFANMPIPNQPFRPAAQTTLRGYIYDRQVTSITSNLDKWAEFESGMNQRNSEFFNWGISARIAELKQFLDKGIPCVICLMGGDGWGHQVVAFDYTMGRYRADLGNHLDDFKISVYDPNHRNVTTTIKANRAGQVFERQDHSGNWRTWFVDKNYHALRPPALPNPNYPKDNLVYELVLNFATGGDDLRGGNDNVDLAVILTDGSQEVYRRINLGARWIVGSDECAQVVLRRPVREDQLRELNVSTTFGGGIGGDNWDMKSLTVYTRGAEFFSRIATAGARRFTGSNKLLTVPLNAPRSLGLDVLVHAQGGGDTVYMEDEFAGSREQSRQLEGFQVTFHPPVAGLGMKYFAHIQNIGDTAWVPDGRFVGTRGRGLRMEGFAIKLTGAEAASYCVEYMAHIQGIGDTLFFKDGAFCGTRGQGRRVEGIRVRVIKKK